MRGIECNNLGLYSMASGYIASLKALKEAKAKQDEATQAVIKIQDSIAEQKLDLGNQSILRGGAVLNIPLSGVTILRVEAIGAAEGVKITHERLCQDPPREEQA